MENGNLLEFVSEFEHLSIYLKAICIYFSVTAYFVSFVHVFTGHWSFFSLTCKNALCAKEIFPSLLFAVLLFFFLSYHVDISKFNVAKFTNFFCGFLVVDLALKNFISQKEWGSKWRY